MQINSVKPDFVTFTTLVSLCAKNQLYSEGVTLHTIIKSLGMENIELSNTLMNFYTKCGKPDVALQLFEQLKIGKMKLNVASWSCAIQALGEKKDIRGAIGLLEEMQANNIKADSILFTILLSLCADNQLYEEGVKLHEIIKVLKISSLELSHTLMNFYTKCGHTNVALQLFEDLKKENNTNAISWNSAIQALVLAKDTQKAIDLLAEMQLLNVKPDTITFTILIGLCAENQYYKEGVKLHEMIKVLNISSLELSNSLMNFYTKCGQPDVALQLFEQLKIDKMKMNVVSWSCAIQALGEKKDIRGAIGLLEEMQANNIKADTILFTILLTLCADNQLYEEGVKLHEIIKVLKISSLELSNTLMNFYTKCGQTSISLEIFEELKKENKTNVVSWNSAIQALRSRKDITRAFELLEEMKKLNIEPDEITYVSLLTLCADSVAIKQGEEVVQQFKTKHIAKSVFWIGATISFHAKVGRLERAESVFNEYLSNNPPFDPILTSVMIDAYAKHGKGKEAVYLYQQIIDRNQLPSAEAVTSVLTACSHAGLVDEARRIYKSIENTQVCTPSHKACMVDVLARSGYLEEAEQFIGSSRDVVSWVTLLGACRIHTNVEIAERTFDILLEIDNEQASHYVQMSHIYNQMGQIDKANEVRELMKRNNATKIPGITTIEVDGETHNFVSDDSYHPRMQEINQELEKLNKEMLDAGYAPDTRWVTRLDVDPNDEKKKKELLCRHSERIAMAFAFISLPKDEPIVMRKNLRVCGDCHTATKFISKIRKREIIVRDASRHHHFKDGKCSCGDFF
ncbi:predicted protein [Naegleria gruberi]|uniref:Predicted protein n=1 Tax=Naegleria gruberi TaxID=5762 RepID=D2V8U1_NAEGR|nr:uncharacterized protein NAEGRDRAFT_32040 [Naegleria gruberi]EFC46752.1 predicted protein [Naegleria gruberi]|eukprot:XP_002679496.1 predicted protein [Naegleria gruberi strain NEG-M]